MLHQLEFGASPRQQFILRIASGLPKQGSRDEEKYDGIA